MNIAALSLGALAVAIAVSCVARLNVGVLALALAWIIGVYFAGMSPNDVMSGFPSQLFITLAGVTLLFTLAHLNGTLEKLAHRAVRICRGNRGMIPMMFFVLGAALASLGPGNIATAALIAPMAMATAGRAGIPLFLMAIMVGNGANAGSLWKHRPTCTTCLRMPWLPSQATSSSEVGSCLRAVERSRPPMKTRPLLVVPLKCATGSRSRPSRCCWSA
jgi:Na+/H+ antiporter NhaD/arsenite permease-like protein